MINRLYNSIADSMNNISKNHIVRKHKKFIVAIKLYTDSEKYGIIWNMECKTVEITVKYNNYLKF